MFDEMSEEFGWFMDWRVWVLVGIFAAILCPIFYKQMVNEIGMSKIKTVLILVLAVFISYLPGKIIIDKGG